jgi:hypothetical protein
MHPWRLVLVVALYLALDVANPMMPGALVFSADDSIEARHDLRFRTADTVDPFTPSPERVTPLGPTVRSTRRPPAAARLLRAHAARAHLPSSVPISPAEDDCPLGPSR